jgi:hypothetical protein
VAQIGEIHSPQTSFNYSYDATIKAHMSGTRHVFIRFQILFLPGLKFWGRERACGGAFFMSMRCRLAAQDVVHRKSSEVRNGQSGSAFRSTSAVSIFWKYTQDVVCFLIRRDLLPFVCGGPLRSEAKETSCRVRLPICF